ncbi:lytic transglycosylase domain-containing protein [Actinomadura atramentaria]|uniref:lytic transglycosylase domain-containing protein n=1 Tax=Actinomadura atramentaria TaxID=1990 RepID=UPI0003AA499B|nr:lytic transglycosylase domain-containing protein [Actinomadura atramentaria]
MSSSSPPREPDAPSPDDAPAGPRRPRRGEKKVRVHTPAAARRRTGRRVRPAWVVGAVAVLAAAGVGGGVYAAVSADGGDAGGGGHSDPPQAGGRPVTTITDDGQVAPLRRVVPPDVLAVSGGDPIPQAKIDALRKVKRVGDVIAVAGGAIQLQGRAVNTFAVDPSAFRSWTPPGTAQNTQLWTALAGNRFVTSSAAAGELRLSQGFPYPVVGRTVPNITMGGSGDLGLPGIDMLVSRKTGEDMGLVRNVAVLVNAPGVDPAKLTRAVKRLLGSGVSAVNLHEKKYQPTGGGQRSGSYLDLYKRAATTCPGLSWTVLAAIGQVESDHGRNAGRSSAGAYGPMQFMPATWKVYGVDGDNDGKADIMNPYDAIPGAAKYLCANGAGRGGKSLYNAIWHYNHADWYVQKVLNLAQAYAARYS